MTHLLTATHSLNWPYFVALLCFIATPGLAFQDSSAQPSHTRIGEWLDDENRLLLLDLYEKERALYARNSLKTSLTSFLAADGSYHQLAYYDGPLPIYRKTLNVEASLLIGAERAKREFGLSGKNTRIGLWDLGYPYLHPEFSSRLFTAIEQTTVSLSTHATHVAGTLIASGLDRKATGFAPDATITSYDWSFDYLEMYAEAGEGLRISNHSYDFEVGWEPVRSANNRWTYWTRSHAHGEYIPWSFFWDSVMEAQPYYLIVKAAGNEQGQGPDNPRDGHYHNDDYSFLRRDFHGTDCPTGFGCLGPAASLKNGLVVGALQPDGESLAPFSSTGPTLDGRLKPDVVSAGVNVYSTINTGSYATSSGTSMAAATVSGSLALLLEQERHLFGDTPYLWGSTLKGLIIHGVDDVGPPGPDFQFGWGRVNIASSVDILYNHLSPQPHTLIQQLDLVEELELTFTPISDEIKATLVWTDPIGPHPNTISDPSQPVLTNQVDMLIEQEGHVHYPYVLDPSKPAVPAITGRNTVDNVEQIHITNAKNAPFSLRISMPATDKAQPVSLIITGAAPYTATLTSESPEIPKNPTISLYPSPARRGHLVTLSFQHRDKTHVRATVYDVTGRHIATVLDQPGYHYNEQFSIPTDWAPGVYIIHIEEQNDFHTLKLLVL